MDDHKLIMISIFGFFKTWKRCIFLMKNMLGKILEFGRMHEKSFIYLFLMFSNISEKNGYFNTGFVFYSVNIQFDIMKNW